MSDIRKQASYECKIILVSTKRSLSYIHSFEKKDILQCISIKICLNPKPLSGFRFPSAWHLVGTVYFLKRCILKSSVKRLISESIINILMYLVIPTMYCVNHSIDGINICLCKGISYIEIYLSILQISPMSRLNLVLYFYVNPY